MSIFTSLTVRQHFCSLGRRRGQRGSGQEAARCLLQLLAPPRGMGPGGARRLTDLVLNPGLASQSLGHLGQGT